MPKLSSWDGIHAVPAVGTENEKRRPNIGGLDGQTGRGINTGGASEWEARPMLSIRNGVDAVADGKRCKLSGGSPASGAEGTGVHSNGPGKRPRIGARKRGFTGTGVGYVDREECERTARTQLTDAFDIGRGVNSNNQACTCEARREWLLDWFQRLADRLRLVRICCGHWDRVCDSESVLTRLGTTGVFLDPPYGDKAGRNMKLYAEESGSVADEVREWCKKWGDTPGMRIALAGYAGEGHEELEALGWKVEAWETAGGYGNQSGKKSANAKKERLWFSPQCNHGLGLFDSVQVADRPPE